MGRFPPEISFNICHDCDLAGGPNGPPGHGVVHTCLSAPTSVCPLGANKTPLTAAYAENKRLLPPSRTGGEREQDGAGEGGRGSTEQLPVCSSLWASNRVCEPSSCCPSGHWLHSDSTACSGGWATGTGCNSHGSRHSGLKLAVSSKPGEETGGMWESYFHYLQLGEIWDKMHEEKERWCIYVHLNHQQVSQKAD